jgi:branched-chain amino acid transport system ATP-binding protein
LVEELFAILARLRDEAAMAMLVVEQNARLALDLADHAFLIETGRMVMGGPAATIGRDENVRRAYLGY